LEKALALNSDSVLNLYLAATAALKTKQYEKALTFSERAVAIEPNNQYIAPVYVEALLYAGIEDIKSTKYARNVKVFK